MEDIQDGIKKSIQDGVEEDPEQEEATTLKHKSFTGVIYIIRDMSNPEIKSEVRGEIGRTAIVGTISSSVVGVVT